MADYDDAVAIVGMAAVFPGAGDVGTFWSNMIGGVDAIGDVPPGRWDVAEFYRPDGVGPAGSRGPRGASDRIYCKRGGFVDELATFDPAAYGIMPLGLDWAEPDQLLALRLAAEAVDDAGGLDTFADRTRIGVVVGRGGYPSAGYARLEQRVKSAAQIATTLREVLPSLSESDVQRVRAAFVDSLGPDRPESAIGLVPNLAASRIANRLDLRGPAYTVDAACASSLIAVDAAVRDLRSGRSDAVVVGGSHLVHEVTFWSVFSLMRALSPSQTIRPFDRHADGILIGEGVGMVVLERLADAERAGRRVYAVVRGTGTASDGRASTLMAPAPEGQILAVRRAWQDAGVDPAVPGAVGLIEAHGTATRAGDGAELTTLIDVFGGGAGTGVGSSSGSGRSSRPRIGVGSVKSMIGHAMPAAGVAGLIKAALALHHRTLPPTLHVDEPHPAFEGTVFEPQRLAADWEPFDGQPRRAGVNAFGFGGINAHVVLEEAPGADRSPSPVGAVAPRPVVSAASAVAAAGVAGVAGTAGVASVVTVVEPDPDVEAVLLVVGSTPAEVAAQLDVPDADLLARDDAANPPVGGPCRLAIVAPNPRRLALARTVAARGRPWRGRNDLWFTTAPLLLGDPSSATDGPASVGGLLAFLFCGLEDKFVPRVDDVCAHFGLPALAVDDTAELGRHGLASVEVGRILDAALRRLGIVPDHVGGHSVGEWNAMISAGLIDESFVDQFVEGFDPDSVEVPGVVFGAVGCGADLVGAVIEDLPDVVVSHDNCPHQSVVCGREAAVAVALERLRARGVLGQRLPFRSGFHSPFLEPYAEAPRQSFARTALRAAQVPMWSATSVDRYPADHDEIRALALRHLLEPVRFRQLTRRLHDEGVRVFVQVGVGSIAGFVDDTLADDQHLSVVSNSPKRSGLDQLRRVAAAVWSEGAAPRFDLLPCRQRPAITAAGEPASAATPASAPVPAAASAARPSRTTVTLALGSPLVRLGSQAATLLPEPVRAEPAEAEPVRRAVPVHAVPASSRARSCRRGPRRAGPCRDVVAGAVVRAVRRTSRHRRADPGDVRHHGGDVRRRRPVDSAGYDFAARGPRPVARPASNRPPPGAVTAAAVVLPAATTTAAATTTGTGTGRADGAPHLLAADVAVRDRPLLLPATTWLA